VKKATALAGLTLMLAASSLHADAISNNISAQLNQSALNAFAKDVGSLMGGGSFHQGKALGFPLGIDIGVHGVGIGLQDDDAILRDDHAHAGSGWLQAELGLPANINIIARGGEFDDARMYGGGLRLGILNPPAPLLPALSVSALYDQLNHDYVNAHTWTANAVLSVDVPFIHPYLGVGWDRTSLKPTDRAFDAAPIGTARDLDATVSGYRAEIGVNLSVIPFTYLNLGAGLANSKALYHAGLGAKF
jgi:hypothetical protein